MELANDSCINNIPFILISLATILIIIFIRNPSSRNCASPPPGPWRLPIIGNLHQVLIGAVPPHRRFRELSLEYGPVMQVKLGELTHVVVSSVESARQVLKTHDASFASRPSLLAADILFYGNRAITFAPYGDYWRRMKKISVLELLSDTRVLSYRSIREEELSSNLVRHISSLADEAGPGPDIVDISELMFCATNRVIARSAFGKVRENVEALLAVVNRISDLLGGFSVADLFPSVKFLPVVTGYKAALTTLHNLADGLLEEIIGEHRVRRASGGIELCDGNQSIDIVDVLLDLQESATDDLEFPMNTVNIKAISTELFLAGSGTASVTIEWAMSELMRNPRVLERAQDEVRKAFRGRGRVEEKGVDDLKYLNAVVKESFRLHPNGPLLAPRESQDDMVVGGYDVPAKTKVMVNVWAIGRDPRHWTDPEAFNPERFLDCSIDYKGNDLEFIPFGAGRRMCPGMSFGVVIVKLGLANLLYHFDWKLPAGMGPEDLDMTERFGITLRRKHPLCLIPVVANTNMP